MKRRPYSPQPNVKKIFDLIFFMEADFRAIQLSSIRSRKPGPTLVPGVFTAIKLGIQQQQQIFK